MYGLIFWFGVFNYLGAVLCDSKKGQMIDEELDTTVEATVVDKLEDFTLLTFHKWSYKIISDNIVQNKESGFMVS